MVIHNTPLNVYNHGLFQHRLQRGPMAQNTPKPGLNPCAPTKCTGFHQSLVHLLSIPRGKLLTDFTDFNRFDRPKTPCPAPQISTSGLIAGLVSVLPGLIFAAQSESGRLYSWSFCRDIPGWKANIFELV